MRYNNRSAFTLIELLVVIAIIGILATLVIVYLGSARSNSRNAAVKSNVSAAGTAIEAFRLEDSSNDKVISNIPGQTDSLGRCGLNVCDILSYNQTASSLSSIFSGKQSTTDPFSYPANFSTTPGAQYFYTYTVPGTLTVGSSRTLVGALDPLPIYNFCGQLQSVFAGGGNAYFCAKDGAQVTQTPYDPNGPQKWVNPHSLPLPGKFTDGSVIWINNLAYIIGMQDPNDTSSTSNSNVSRYDPYSNTSCALTQLVQPSNVYGPSAAFDGNHTIYIFGGLGGQSSPSSIYAFDINLYTCATPDINTLKPIATKLAINTYNSNAFFANGKFYIVGGVRTYSIQEFDPILNSVKVVASFPSDVEHMAVFYSKLKNIAYIVGGNNNDAPSKDKTPLNTIFEFNLLTKSLTLDPTTLPEGVSSQSTAWDETNQKGYLIAGWKGIPSKASQAITVFDATTSPPTASFPIDQKIVSLYGGDYSGLNGNFSIFNNSNSDSSKWSVLSFGGYFDNPSKNNVRQLIEYFPYAK